MLQTTPLNQPMASSRISDNYCVTKLQTRLLAGSQSPVTRKTLKDTHAMTLAKERLKSRSVNLLSRKLQIKICERCFLCHSVVL